MKKYKKTIFFITLIPVIILVLVGYFSNKSVECYTTLSKIRYNVNNSYFELSATNQQFQNVNESLIKILENYIPTVNTKFSVDDMKILFSILGILLNLSGTLLIAYSFGENLEGAYQINKRGRKIYLVSFLLPKGFKLGLLFIILSSMALVVSILVK